MAGTRSAGNSHDSRHMQTRWDVLTGHAFRQLTDIGEMFSEHGTACVLPLLIPSSYL
jgi:hypothetical protein